MSEVNMENTNVEFEVETIEPEGEVIITELDSEDDGVGTGVKILGGVLIGGGATAIGCAVAKKLKVGEKLENIKTARAEKKALKNREYLEGMGYTVVEPEVKESTEESVETEK